MSPSRRIYLDHAATSWPKSTTVLAEVDTYARLIGATAGRGNYRSAEVASQQIGSARRELAKLIGATSSESISLHSSGTTALNAVILGLLAPGDHVITTAADHNSVLRPLHHLQQTIGIELTVVPCDPFGKVSIDEITNALRHDTRMVVMTHASNVTGAVQPIDQIAELVANTSTLLVVDAAQTLGYIPVDVSKIGCHALASPGHKGIGGPLGTGLLYLSEQIQQEIRPTVFGGTGSQSESLEMPATYPEKLEPGNMNVPAIAGLAVAANRANEIDFALQVNRLKELSTALHDSLSQIAGMTFHSQAGPLPIASVSISTMPAADIAAILDVEFGIETRAGFHCAALIQPFIQCAPGGTLRISASPQTDDEEIRAVVSALESIASVL